MLESSKKLGYTEGIVSIIVNTLLFGIKIWVGLAASSVAMTADAWHTLSDTLTSLIADGWHHRSDALASLMIVVGAIAGKYVWWIDGALGIGVSALIVYAAYDIAKTAFNALMGENASPDFSERIKKIAGEASPELKDIHHIHMHRYGDHLEITLHARLNENTKILDAHNFSTKLEQELRKELNADTTVHIEPEK
ncbi:hypothetical protein SPIRO4BDMA_70227 [uncultured spirochete]|uniref:Uncharacterized protein n=1 Tax=uncultured spirochete TaxID=156406 RepID=A0A3P3XUZ1_9SPIR|nr:hypothetical protein SPIRO4BDMA_70227 [uncultured spirochete]